MRFLHISDIHLTGRYTLDRLFELGPRRWPALGELFVFGRAKHYAHATQTLQTVQHDFASLKCDHLIVSGDLTAYALEEEFDMAKAALGPLVDSPQKATVIPGNHDTYTPGAIRDRRFERRFGHLTESDLPDHTREGVFPFVRLLGDDVAVVGLLSARIPFVPSFSFGVIGRRQLEGLAAVMADPKVKDRFVFVVVHHAPLAKDGGPDKKLHGLTDAKELFALVNGPKRAVLHGHIHHRYHHEPSSTQPHIFGAGSSTQHGREGFWVYDVADGELKAFEMRVPGATQKTTTSAHHTRPGAEPHTRP